MHPDFQQLMSHATQLTQSGDLTAATAAIQAALRGVSPASTPTPHNWRDDANVIDVEVRVVPDTGETSRATNSDTDEVAEAETTVDDPISGDAFITRSFRNSAGRRNYKLYVPPNPGNTPMPLVVMLHGCTQDADDFAAGTAMNQAAREQGFYVLYPVQSTKANPQKCWNWFKHNHQQRGRGEPSILADMTREVMKSHSIDPQRVYVAGLSAGGAMAAILAQAHPELYAAVGVHSGLAPGVASDLPSALAAMKGNRAQAPVQKGTGVPTIVFHGDRDATVASSNAPRVVATNVGPSARVDSVRISGSGAGRASTKHLYRNSAGEVVAEYWEIHGAGHAWAGGTTNGSYTDPAGPNATAEMLRFFFGRPLRRAN